MKNLYVLICPSGSNINQEITKKWKKRPRATLWCVQCIDFSHLFLVHMRAGDCSRFCSVICFSLTETCIPEPVNPVFASLEHKKIVLSCCSQETAYLLWTLMALEILFVFARFFSSHNLIIFAEKVNVCCKFYGKTVQFFYRIGLACSRSAALAHLPRMSAAVD